MNRRLLENLKTHTGLALYCCRTGQVSNVGGRAGRSISRESEDSGKGTQKEPIALHDSRDIRAASGDPMSCVTEGTREGPGLVPPGERHGRCLQSAEDGPGAQGAVTLRAA